MTATASTEAPPASSAKRARFLAATGLPAVLIAGGVILPNIAHAAPTAASAACPAGTVPSAIPQQTGATPQTAATPGANALKKAQPAPSPSGTTPAAPHPGGTPSAPVPSGTTPKTPAPSGSPSTPAPGPSTPATTPAPPPKSTPTNPPPTWWDPLTWFNSTTASAQIFNPQPSAQSGVRDAAVNKLASTKVANPAVVAAMKTTASTPPPSTPSSPAPSTPAAPTSTSSGTPSTPSASTPATPPPTTPSTVCVKPMAASAVREALWHLDATSLTLYTLTYNGVITINTAQGPVNVLDFHADSADVVSMITYSTNPANGKNVFSNGGRGETVHLTNVHLHVLQQTGNLGGLIPVTLAPGNLITDLLGIAQGVPVPIPLLFTDVHVDQYLLTADTLSIPGFNVLAQQ